jgi:hypothetical protein
MKKFIIGLFLLIGVNTFAQSDKFEAALGSALKQLGDAKDASELADVAARFERIGDAEKTQWLPYYYAALTKARMSMQSMGGDRDKVADDAQSLIDKAKAIEKNSEILCVESMIATAKMLVNPQARWMEYGRKSMQLLEDAKKADATNPRPYALQSTSLKNTPEAFGGGCASAKPVAEKAMELFKSFKALSPLHPNWGKDLAQSIIDGCK